ncbi:MAG: ABC transporter permease, partial [Dehalococcoidia bacterium]
MQPREVGAGSIYDLGYRNYAGRRLGRLNAFMTLFWFSLRSAFGISRGGRAKIIPMGLAAIVFVPAGIQLGIAAIASDAIDFIRPEEYYGFVFIIIALFTAAIAPELVGRDQRNHTLALYFSRPLLRSDYAMAKLGAAGAALLVLTLGPQVLLFVGNAFAGNDFRGYLSDEGDTILPILATAVILSVYISAIGLAIAAQTPRRAYASGAI